MKKKNKIKVAIIEGVHYCMTEDLDGRGIIIVTDGESAMNLAEVNLPLDVAIKRYDTWTKAALNVEKGIIGEVYVPVE